MEEFESIGHYSSKSSESLQGLVVGLSGGLGAGKTHFVKKLVEKLDPETTEVVSSPTFNICNIYQLNQLTIHHYDLYRMEDEEDLENIGIWESLHDENVLVFVEWVDLFPSVKSCCNEILTIEIVDENTRSYQIEALS